MPLSDTYPNGVLFVGVERPTKEGDKERTIVGTSFVVRIPGLLDEKGPRVFHPWIVTAKHVINHSYRTFLRVPMKDGTVCDLDVEEWVIHPDQDVAVVPIEPPAGHALVATDLRMFVDDSHWRDRAQLEAWWQPVGFQLRLGGAVYFVGLLGHVPAMTERNIPIVRAGTIGRLWQDQLPVKRSPVDKVEYITAHLIDCRSFAGFSGSPCYAQESTVWAMDNALRYRDGLFGMMGGHFDDWALTRDRDDPDGDYEGGISDNIEAPVSTGVGYVTPAEYIRETLMLDECVEFRQEADESHEANGTALPEGQPLPLDPGLGPAAYPAPERE